MIVRPKIRGFICTTAHPKGCEAHVLEQINYVKKRGCLPNGPRKVLIIGGSTGYGLASQIVTAFGCHASTTSISFEKEPTLDHTASAGWYNMMAFKKFATAEKLQHKNINGDAFSDAIKSETIEYLKDEVGQLDLIIYSIASPRRTHPKTGVTAKSVLKPIGSAFFGKTLNTDKAEITEVSIEPATEQEIQETVAVMGGEDWELWIEALDNAGLIAEGCRTIAYTYLGAKPTWAIYGRGAIGRAKQDLERAAATIQQRLMPYKGSAFLGVMKAIVTQASSAIPIMPLYISLLYKIMKEKNIHENCMEQIYRLFSTKLYDKQPVQMDEFGWIRMDDLELQPEVQNTIEELWEHVSTENLFDLTDFKGYQKDFLKLFGFGFSSIDYEAEVDPTAA